MRFGLVLGAGGAAGWVFHTGVLRAMADDYGLDPSAADLVVGTSAGSAVAAATRAGFDAAAILGAVTTPPSAEQRSKMMREVARAPKSLMPLSPGLARHVFPGGKGVTMALSGVLPPGWFPTLFLASFPGVGAFEDWPEGLWIPAVRARDGSVVVFGRDRRDASVAAAVEASSAVPGLFQPRMIGSETFVDGGAASPTHASLLIGENVDLAIISAPMSKPTRWFLARHAREKLASEVDALERAGIPTVVIEPSSEAVAAARGFPRRNPGAAPLIVDHAVQAARTALAAA